MEHTNRAFSIVQFADVLIWSPDDLVSARFRVRTDVRMFFFAKASRCLRSLSPEHRLASHRRVSRRRRCPEKIVPANVSDRKPGIAQGIELLPGRCDLRVLLSVSFSPPPCPPPTPIHHRVSSPTPVPRLPFRARSPLRSPSSPRSRTLPSSRRTSPTRRSSTTRSVRHGVDGHWGRCFSRGDWGCCCGLRIGSGCRRLMGMRGACRSERNERASVSSAVRFRDCQRRRRKS